MKILLVVHGLRPEFAGGTEIYVEHLARGLADRGHTIVVLAGTREPGPPGVCRREGEGVEVLLLRRPDKLFEYWAEAYSSFAGRAFARLLDTEGFDLVHVHHWKRLTLSLVHTAAARRIPSVVSLHDLWTSCPREHRLLEEGPCDVPLGGSPCPPCVGGFWWQDLDEVAEIVRLNAQMIRGEIALASRCLVPSESHRRRLANVLEMDERRFEVVPLSLPGDRTAPAAGRREATFPQGPLRIAYWGHLVPFKGPHLLLEALADFQDLDRVEVHLFGEASSAAYRVTLERLARRKPVTFHGRFDFGDIAAFPIDLAVIPSLCSESHCFVLDEAYRLGIPVLASDAGALAERVGSGGMLFRQGDARQLSGLLREILATPEKLTELRSGIPFSEGAWDRHLERIEATYRDAAEGGVAEGRALPAEALLEHRERALDRRRALLVDLREKADRSENLEANLGRYREVNRNLESQCRDQRKAITELTADLEGHREVLRARDREVASLKEVCGNLEADLRGHRDVLRHCQADNEELRSVAEVLRKDLDGHRAVLRDVQEDLGRHREVVAALQEERRRILEDAESLQASLREREARIDRLGAELGEAATRLEASTVQFEATRARLENEIDSVRTELARAQALAESRSERISDLEGRLRELNRVLVVRICRAVSPKVRNWLDVKSDSGVS